MIDKVAGHDLAHLDQLRRTITAVRPDSATTVGDLHHPWARSRSAVLRLGAVSLFTAQSACSHIRCLSASSRRHRRDQCNDVGFDRAVVQVRVALNQQLHRLDPPRWRPLPVGRAALLVAPGGCSHRFW